MSQKENDAPNKKEYGGAWPRKARQYSVRKHDELNSEGRPGGYRLENFDSVGQRHGYVPSSKR